MGKVEMVSLEGLTSKQKLHIRSLIDRYRFITQYKNNTRYEGDKKERQNREML